MHADMPRLMLGVVKKYFVQEKIMNRIEIVRKFVDDMLLNKKDAWDRRCAYVHLYGVSLVCGLIAKKRGANIELAIMTAMLHDLYSYKTEGVPLIEDKVVKAGKDADVAREILDKLNITTPDETNDICNAVCYRGTGDYSELGEILLDANLLQSTITSKIR